jgi:phage shock protein A
VSASRARRNRCQQIAGGFKQQYEEQAKQVAGLKEALEQLEAKISEAETKKTCCWRVADVPVPRRRSALR